MNDKTKPDDQPQAERWVVLSIGGLVALAAGIGIAVIFMDGGDKAAPPPPASQGGLVVQTARPDQEKLDPSRPLRCFVDGQFVGEVTLAECARKNGVATGSLDVGLDETGALAAAEQAGTVLTPLPPQPKPAPVAAPPPVEAAAPVPLATCWRYGRDGWRELGEMGRGACVKTLFAGRCESRGDALYGRWGEQTLRLITGRVEVSNDNSRFRTLAEQGPGCSLPTVE